MVRLQPSPALAGLLALVCVGPLGSGALAQSLYAAKGGVPLEVIEFTGSPQGACGWPGGPVILQWIPNSNGDCAVILTTPPPPSFVGDIAVNRLSNRVWATDGTDFGEYHTNGKRVNAFTLSPNQIFPGPVTGMGFDSGGTLIWLTDGVQAAAIAPPPSPAAPACANPPTVVVAPFNLPIAGTATDIEWDPATGALWVCDTTGWVTQVQIGGALGPYGSFDVAGSGSCTLSPGLTGLAVDLTSAGPVPTLFVTDGQTIYRFDVPGTPAAPSFSMPAACFPAPVPNLVGLGFSAHAIPYGTGNDNEGLPVPSIGSTGHTTVPNFVFLTILKGAAPGGTAVLVLSSGAACPAPTILGNPVLISTAPLLFLATGTVPAVGSLTLPTPIPPGVPIGVTLYEQWWVLKPDGWIQTSGGLSLTTSR